LANQKQGAESEHIYYTLLWQVLGFAVDSPASAKAAKMLGQNRFAQPNWHVLTFLHPMNVQGHIGFTG
jgi:hypothetical protein